MRPGSGAYGLKSKEPALCKIFKESLFKKENVYDMVLFREFKRALSRILVLLVNFLEFNHDTTFFSTSQNLLCIFVKLSPLI
jgi:hypothetical protein